MRAMQEPDLGGPVCIHGAAQSSHLCRDSSAAWFGVRTRGDKLKGELGKERTWAGPIAQAYNMEVRRAFLP